MKINSKRESQYCNTNEALATYLTASTLLNLRSRRPTTPGTDRNHSRYVLRQRPPLRGARRNAATHGAHSDTCTAASLPGSVIDGP
jgi:hypothetical protein